jgi:two-component system, OmpR family, osmolarity sensor histidine kinase EnvZ
MSRVWPDSLLARTALLIGGTLIFFGVSAWLAIVWTTMIPAADVTAQVLAQRVTAAQEAYQAGRPLPEGVELAPAAVLPDSHHRDVSLSLYLSRLCKHLEASLPASEVVLVRSVLPTLIWVRTPATPPHGLLLRWQVSRPGTPVAVGLVVLLVALVALLGAALFARRLTAPLADLARATQAVARGERVTVDTRRGPAEVRSLAADFQAMSTRLAELRELMLAGLSHDLRSPLARVRVAVELLSGATPDLVQQIALDVEDMDRIIGQFLRYLRAGYREQPVPGCADDILRGCLASYPAGGAVCTQLAAGELRLLAADSLRRIVANLVQNALEHGRPPVIVRSALGPGHLRISVEDRGPGIPAQEWAEALRPFRRLRAAPRAGSSGLGLAIVERLVHASQGSFTGRQIEGGFVVEVTLAAPSPSPA